ncbi:unnamed protein product [Closterium sp. Yama58-4]|nr:unnamed protein product [Closterium sp. Yama58-4]
MHRNHPTEKREMPRGARRDRSTIPRKRKWNPSQAAQLERACPGGARRFSASRSWRLQASSLVLLPGFLFELIQFLLTWRSQRSRRERILSRTTAHSIGESLNETESARILSEEDPDIPELEQQLQQHASTTPISQRSQRDDTSPLPQPHTTLTSPPLPPPLTLVLLLLLSACALALHFALWILSLRLTSLAHSLLFVSTPPLLLALAHLVSGAPLSRAEALGTLLGGVGAAVVALGRSAGISGGRSGAGRSLTGVSLGSGAGVSVESSNSVVIGGSAAGGGGFGSGGSLGGGNNNDDDAVSMQGDVAALLAAAAFVVYVWPLGWLSPPFLAPTLFLALGPGYMGHTGLNALLRYTTPLVIAIAITVEPPLGSLIGWAIGQSGAPDAATWVGGALMVGATLWVALEAERARGRE